MRTLSPPELLEMWEQGGRQHPLDRALTLLAAACPETSREELSRLSIGERDRLLLALRRQVFGPRLEVFAECPRCRAEMEFAMNVDNILAGVPDQSGAERSLEMEGLNISFRLPSSLDLAAVAGLGPVEAHDRLLERCVLSVARGGKAVDGRLLEDVVAKLAERMGESEPLSEMQISLQCVACGHRWTLLLDVLTYLWDELGLEARRLLGQVHALAQSYGWSETEILAMTAWRRRHSLAMVSA